MSDFRDRLGTALEQRAAALPGDLRVPTEAERAAWRDRLRQAARASGRSFGEPDQVEHVDHLRALLRAELNGDTHA